MNHAIELSVLSPMASVESMIDAFEAVQQNGFATLTVPPFWIKKLHRDWPESAQAILSTVIGYPLGYQRTETKQTETECALLDFSFFHNCQLPQGYFAFIFHSVDLL